MSEIREQTAGKWIDILHGLGVEPYFLQNKHTKCPFCGGKDRYRFDNKDGNGTFICGQCGAGDGFQFVQKMFGWNFAKTAEEIRNIIGECKKVVMTKKDPKVALKTIAKMAKPIKNDSDLIKYLKGRGVTSCPDSLKEANLYYYEDGTKTGTFPTLVSLVTNKQGKGVTYHLTYTHRQAKLKCAAPKKIMTPVHPIKGGYVELYKVEEHIAVAEGIETALSIRDQTELPVLSALNAQNLAALDLPDIVKRVDIYADNDASYCGQRAAYTLAERLVRAGIKAEVKLPPVVGEDWLDFYNRTRTEALENLKDSDPDAYEGFTKLMETFGVKYIDIKEINND
jgi:putative DNA primase/helicase